MKSFVAFCSRSSVRASRLRSSDAFFSYCSFCITSSASRMRRSSSNAATRSSENLRWSRSCPFSDATSSFNVSTFCAGRKTVRAAPAVFFAGAGSGDAVSALDSFGVGFGTVKRARMSAFAVFLAYDAVAAGSPGGDSRENATSGSAGFIS